MTFLSRPAALAVALAVAVGGVGLPAGSAQAAVKATRVSGWTAKALVARQGQVVRLRLAVRPARKSAARTVVLQRRASGSAQWTNVTTARTGKRGALTLRVPTTRSFDGVVRLRVAATRKARATVTPARHLVVRAGAGTGTVPPTTDVEREVVRLVNVARATARSCGSQHFGATTPVRVNDRLSKAARDHALDMGRRGYFSHDSLDGRTFVDRVHAAGYSNPSAENIAAGYPTPAAVVSGWLSSPGHCANIMARDAVDLGVGFASVPGSEYDTYWVQDFGRG